MKLLFIVADVTYVGGIERVISNLSDSFVSNSIEVEILSLYKTNKRCNFEIDPLVSINFLNDNIKFDNSPGSLGRMFKHFKNILKLKKYLNEKKYDVIISNSFPTSFQLFFSEKKCQWITYEHVYYDYYSELSKKIRNLIYKRFDKIVVLTKNDKNYFEKYFGNVYQIFNPIGFRSKDKSLLDKKIIIATGRLEKQKGFDLLIDAFKLVSEKEPSWELRIFGEGGERSKLENKIIESNLKNIKLMGHSDNIKNEMLNASIFVMSSRFEGFGMVLVEAMECGLACVSFNCPNGPSDIIHDDVNGLLCENGNIEELSENILRLCNSKELRIELSLAAIKSTERFNIEKITDNWFDIIKDNNE